MKRLIISALCALAVVSTGCAGTKPTAEASTSSTSTPSSSTTTQASTSTAPTTTAAAPEVTTPVTTVEAAPPPVSAGPPCTVTALQASLPSDTAIVTGAGALPIACEGRYAGASVLITPPGVMTVELFRADGGAWTRLPDRALCATGILAPSVYVFCTVG